MKLTDEYIREVCAGSDVRLLNTVAGAAIGGTLGGLLFGPVGGLLFGPVGAVVGAALGGVIGNTELRSQLVADKIEIQGQLASAKADFREDKARYSKQGLRPRDAIERASTDAVESGEVDWRAKAIDAAGVKDRQLLRIKNRLKELNVQQASAQDEGRRVRVEVFRGVAEDIAEAIRNDGGFLVTAFPFERSVIAIYRAAKTPEAA